VVVVLGGLTSAHAAALTTPVCLAKKLRAWGNLRRCQAVENGKALEGKASTLVGCQTTFQNALAKINEAAAAATLAYRYGANGDGTLTDYDTGLQWEQKTNDGSVHDASNYYAWSDSASGAPDGPAFTVFLGTLNDGVGASTGTGLAGLVTAVCFAGHCDWRLPAIEELIGPEIDHGNQGQTTPGSQGLI
jgi:hypothetical protein